MSTLTLTSGATFSAPDDWPGMADKIQCWGGGGTSTGDDYSGQPADGGGGGAYAEILNQALADGAAMQIGIPSLDPSDHNSDTWIGGASLAASVCGAQGGTGSSGYTSPGSKGLASASVGTTKYDGGSGGSRNANLGGGGGGAAGPNGAGADGTNATGSPGAGGAGDNGSGGAGGASGSDGSDGTEVGGVGSGGGGGGGNVYGAHPGNGGNCGAGGGSGTSTSNLGLGKPGLILITYTPGSPGPVPGSSAGLTTATAILGTYDSGGATASANATASHLSGNYTNSSISGLTVSGGTTAAETFTLTLASPGIPPGVTGSFYFDASAIVTSAGGNGSTGTLTVINNNTTAFVLSSDVADIEPTGLNSASLTLDTTGADIDAWVPFGTVTITPADWSSLVDNQTLGVSIVAGAITMAARSAFTFHPPEFSSGILSVSGVSASSVTLSWDDAAYGTEPYMYNVRRVSDDAIIQANASSPAVIFGLASGTAYGFYLESVDADLDSVNSNSVSISTTCATPAGVRAAAGDTTARITWNAVTGAATYKVYVDGVLTDTIAAPTLVSNLSDLVNGATVTITVTATGANSQASTASTGINITPMGVIAVGLDDMGDAPNRIVSWSRETGDSDHYKLYKNGALLDAAASSPYTESGTAKQPAAYQVKGFTAGEVQDARGSASFGSQTNSRFPWLAFQPVLGRN